MNLPLSFHLRNADETEQFGAALGDILRSESAHAGSILLLLSGDLGAGKTTLVRGLARGLGAVDSAVASPTFTIRMDHRTDGRPLIHIDCWRIGPADLDSIGFDEILSGNAVVAIEWPERVSEALPARSILLRLDHGTLNQDSSESVEGESTRTLVIDAPAFDPREQSRIADGLSILVQAPRITSPRCPVCGRPSTGESATDAPFCSRRCRMADLGDWLLMRHRIAGTDQPEFDE